MELKLTNVARASLEELRLDYEDFPRQRGLPLLPPNHPALERFKAKRCASLEEVGAWLKEEQRRTRTETQTGTRTDADGQGHQPTSDPSAPSPISTPALVANAALSLLNLCCYLLDRQIAAQAKAFEEEGGLYRAPVPRALCQPREQTMTPGNPHA